jgi:hypothetical protein
MAFVAEQLAVLCRHLDHLRGLHPKISGVGQLREDLSLRNDVFFSWLMVCQAVLQIAGELSARRQVGFRDFKEAVCNLVIHSEFPAAGAKEIEFLPELRDQLIFNSASLDPQRAIDAFEHVSSVEEFVEIIRRLEAAG